FEWGDATAVDIALNYGGIWDGASIERVPGPFTEPIRLDISRRGSFWVALLDSKGRVLGVEGSALGPVTE
ncbi:MAG: hypothetical protein ACRDLB_06935, partial [Actinomycetota bacterium]